MLSPSRCRTVWKAALGFCIGMIISNFIHLFTTISLSSSNINNDSASFAIPVLLNQAHPSSSPSTAAAAAIQQLQVTEFERQERVVIVTKIHGENHQWESLTQSLCLLTVAYNRRVYYDIVVFTTMEIPSHQVQSLQQVVAPANLTVVVDNPGLIPMVQKWPESLQQRLLQRCEIHNLTQLDWYLACKEPKRKQKERLAYTWQAEFRALHLWNHPALAPQYRYMMWLDSDAFCSQVWDRDPIAVFIQNNLTIMFDHFPGGISRGSGFQPRIVEAFNETLCSISLTRKGTLRALGGKNNDDCPSPQLKQIHGFFHITDMDFYRSPPVMHWLRTLISPETKFSRRFDDQLAVTVPAAKLAPQTSWDMEKHGMQLNVFHNSYMDGKRHVTGSGTFVKWFATHGNQSFPEATGKCHITIGI